jgi:hypothetical protein
MMTVLSQLLPGLRDVRTPFIVGMAWFISLWLWLHKLDVARSAGKVLSRELADLHQLGGPAWLAAGSVGIYLLGSLLIVDGSRSGRSSLQRRFLIFERKEETPWLRGGEKCLRVHGEDAISLMQWLLNDDPSRDVRADKTAILNTVEATISKLRSTRSPVPAEWHDKTLTQCKRVAFQNAVRRLLKRGTDWEPRTTAVRLHIANPELWSEYDRLTSEATLRLSLAPALLASALAVTILDWLPLVGLLLLLSAFALNATGDLKACSANSILIQARTTEVVHEPYLAVTTDDLGQLYSDAFVEMTGLLDAKSPLPWEAAGAAAVNQGAQDT